MAGAITLAAMKKINGIYGGARRNGSETKITALWHLSAYIKLGGIGQRRHKRNNEANGGVAISRQRLRMLWRNRAIVSASGVAAIS